MARLSATCREFNEVANLVDHEYRDALSAGEDVGRLYKIRNALDGAWIRNCPTPLKRRR